MENNTKLKKDLGVSAAMSIVVGCVIGAGDHDTLMETCSEYSYLAQIQMGDGKEAF